MREGSFFQGAKTVARYGDSYISRRDALLQRCLVVIRRGIFTVDAAMTLGGRIDLAPASSTLSMQERRAFRQDPGKAP